MLTIIFVFIKDIYSVFFIDERLIKQGVNYLIIIGLAQIPRN